MIGAPHNLLLDADRLRWSNRLAAWRAEPVQTAFHGLALTALALVVAGWLSTQHAPLRSLLAIALAHPIAACGGLFLIGALDQRRAQRRLLARWRVDWLAAEPVPALDRRAYRWWRGALRSATQTTAMAALLIWLDGLSTALIAGMFLLALGGFAGGFSAAWAAPRRRRLRRRTPFTPRGTGSLWRWQRQSAGNALAPRSLAPWIGVWLLVPRGPAVMLGVALFLLALGLLASAWRRMLAVFPAAQRWLACEGVPARVWILPALVLPIGVLASGGALTALALWRLQAPTPFFILVLGSAMLAALSLFACAAERRQPRRLALVLPLHLALLLGASQVIPPLLPLLWLLQCAYLLRRSLR